MEFDKYRPRISTSRKKHRPQKVLISLKPEFQLRTILRHIKAQTRLSQARVVLWAVRYLYAVLVKHEQIEPHPDITEEVLTRAF